MLEDGTAPIALKDTDGQTISSDKVQKTVLANLGRGFAQIATVDEVISALGSPLDPRSS